MNVRYISKSDQIMEHLIYIIKEIKDNMYFSTCIVCYIRAVYHYKDNVSQSCRKQIKNEKTFIFYAYHLMIMK